MISYDTLRLVEVYATIAETSGRLRQALAAAGGLVRLYEGDSVNPVKVLPDTERGPAIYDDLLDVLRDLTEEENRIRSLAQEALAAELLDDPDYANLLANRAQEEKEQAYQRHGERVTLDDAREAAAYAIAGEFLADRVSDIEEKTRRGKPRETYWWNGHYAAPSVEMAQRLSDKGGRAPNPRRRR